ncbi:MAG: hypothetical protein NZM16_10250, partial [Thermoflexus sp.]
QQMKEQLSEMLGSYRRKPLLQAVAAVAKGDSHCLSLPSSYQGGHDTNIALPLELKPPLSLEVRRVLLQTKTAE